MLTYGMMYGMRRTTVYLPDSLKARIERLAEEQQRSEAEVIRTALQEYTQRERPRPRGGLLATLGEPVAHRVEEILAEGFGRA
jgi:metal-responsive CopG/Arc/MetJ family transcriptional regulator